jgi:eukaryotic-like serine/threonine-protein kinase
MMPSGQLLTATDWALLQELFDSASQLPPGDRPAFLERACAGRTTLRTQVEALLLSLDSESVLEPAVRRAVSDTARAAGDRIGPYEVIRALGEGGMGVVYLAARADDAFQKVVAIKLLRTAWLSDDMRRRFQLERQILARLEHPNIARLLDGGTVDGAPYVAMEYVDGLPIDQYCREPGLSVPERLRLFRQLCDAVAYAHRNLVIHRDIKPGNVLVTAGVPKLLDFGIAKLLQSEGTPGGLALTQTGDRLMTPDYASPEQVRGESISTASDIYSLGVLLYELLADERPFRTSGLTPGEIERAICTEEPPKLSTRAPRRNLEGDLDNIVSMAMRKEPARRYASADQLSEDIRRYLDGFPVTARKDTWSYHASKFIRRHKVAVAAAAAASVTIVGFAVGMSLLARRVTVERDTARTERTRAQQVSHLLLDTFRVSDPEQGDPGKVTAREILDRAAETIGKQNLDPAIGANMYETLGQVYENLGVYDRSRQEFDRARSLTLKLYGSGSSQYAHILENLAGLSGETGAWDESEKLLRQAIALRAKHPDIADDRAGALLTLSTVLRKQGRYPEAERAARDSIAIFRQSPADRKLEIATGEAKIADVFLDQGKNADAEALLRDALALKRQGLRGDNMQVAELLDELGQVRLLSSDYKQAEQFYGEALRMYAELQGENSRYVGTVQNNLAVTYNWEGNLPAAVAMGKQAIATQRKLSGDSDPETLTLMGNEAGNLHNQGNHKEEVALQDEMAGIAVHVPELGAPQRLSVMRARNTVLYDRGEYRAAERGVREEIDKRRAMGASPRFLAQTLSELGNTLLAQGRLKDAEQAYRMAVDQFPAKEKATLQAARADERLGRALALEGRNAEASETLNNTISILHATTGPTHYALASALFDLGELELAQHHSSEAGKLLDQAAAIRTRIMVPEAWEITVTECALARARGDAARLRALKPALNRCAATSWECRDELRE